MLADISAFENLCGNSFGNTTCVDVFNGPSRTLVWQSPNISYDVYRNGEQDYEVFVNIEGESQSIFRTDNSQKAIRYANAHIPRDTHNYGRFADDRKSYVDKWSGKADNLDGYPNVETRLRMNQ